MAGALNIPLAEYLRAAGPEPFGWGTLDCVLFVAGWIEKTAGIDPAAPWREAYRSEAGAHRLIVNAGGFGALISDAMARAGLAETAAPLPGDVGVIETALGPTMAIRSPLGWVCKTPAGIACLAATPVKAWSV